MNRGFFNTILILGMLVAATLFTTDAAKRVEARHRHSQQPVVQETSESQPDNNADASAESTSEGQPADSSSDSSAETAPSARQDSEDKDLSLMHLVFTKGPVYLFIMVFFVLASSGALGLIPGAIVWHTTKLFRGGKPPEIG